MFSQIVSYKSLSIHSLSIAPKDVGLIADFLLLLLLLLNFFRSLLGLLLILHLQLIYLLCQLGNGICCSSRGFLSGHGWGSLSRCGISRFILGFLLLDLLGLHGLLLLLLPCFLGLLGGSSGCLLITLLFRLSALFLLPLLLLAGRLFPQEAEALLEAELLPQVGRLRLLLLSVLFGFLRVPLPFLLLTLLSYILFHLLLFNISLHNISIGYLWFDLSVLHLGNVTVARNFSNHSILCWSFTLLGGA